MNVSWGITVFILTMFSLIFWMIPHSIDKAVILPWFNRVMHVNMFAAGFFVVPAFRQMIFEIKIVFLGMISAMVIATGITLTVFNILLCSAFNIVQQRQTGTWLIIIGTLLFITTLFTFFRGVGKR